MKANMLNKSLALAATALGVAFGAQATPNPSVSYIDEYGQVTNITEYTLIDKDQNGSQPLSGVHVVGADYNGDGKIDAADALVKEAVTSFTFLQGASVGSTGKDSAKIILADGFALDMASSLNVYNGSSFSVYGQEKGTGKMNVVGPQGVGGITDNGTGCQLKIYGGNIIALGGDGKTNNDGKPGIDGFATVQINGGVMHSFGGAGGNIMPAGGKKAPGPAFKVGSLKAADDILLKDGTNAASATNIVYTSDEELASRVTGRYARFVTPNYLTFTAQTSGSTIKFVKDAGEKLMINTNGTWVAYTDGDLITLANAGDKVQFKGKGVKTNGITDKWFVMTGRIGASGSVTSLTDENGGDPDVTLSSMCYACMFQYCAALTSLPDLPATTLTEFCYGDLFNGCSHLAVNTNATEGSKLWFVPATESKDEWNIDMFKGTAGNFTGDPELRTAYYVAPPEDLVTVVVPEVAGATAQLYAFDVNGGWLAAATNEVPSNAMVRVVWTADDDKVLSGDDAVNVFRWQSAAFGPVSGGEEAPAPKSVGASGESEVSIGLDTRTNKMYFDAKHILPIWYAQGAEVTVKGEQATTLVKNAASTNTVAWTPVAGTNEFAHTLGGLKATIILTVPVEVTTNGLEVAGTTVAVTDEGGQPLVAQAEGEFAGKILVPSNSVVKVTYTTTNGVYFADGSKTYVQTLTADKKVTDVAPLIVKPEVPAAPSVKVGVVAQRYPWDGKLDVQFWAKNTPAGKYALKVSVKIGDDTYDDTFDGIKTGIDTVVFDLSNVGEVTSKNCKVWVELIED